MITFIMGSLYLYMIYYDFSFFPHFPLLPSTPLSLLIYKPVSILSFFLFLFPSFLSLFPLPSSCFLLNNVLLFPNVCYIFLFLFTVSISPTREIIQYLHVFATYFTYDYGLKVHSFSYKHLKKPPLWLL